MCGIAGIVSRPPLGRLSGVVRHMIALQKHRGPDGEGFHESAHAALGHCRLAVLDLSAAGHQPMPDRERRYWITYNGEIYNYVELAQELMRAGHGFHSRCDTEVLLTAYREWGPACLDRLRGMFAFAVWDEQEQRLFAARDRLGIKPFHYWMNTDATTMAFASELKALLEFLPERRINARLAGEFLAWNLLDHDPADTMLQDIRRLPAGHWLTWNRKDGLHVQRYWTFEVNEELRSSPAERLRLIDEFREQFAHSISIHLRSDVPVGSCLSGGLDSSSIVCRVSAELEARGVTNADWQHTFSACFEDPALDERQYIETITKATHSRNHQVFPDGDRLAGEIDTWLWHQEEPVGGFSAYSQFCVARLAREQGIKVVLDGQGADEQLLGYRKFILAYLRQLLHNGRYVGAAREARQFLLSKEAFAGASLAEGMRYWSRSVPEGSQLWPGDGPPVRPTALGLAPPMGRRIHADITTFSLPILLRYEDRNTMAFGLEARVPFVDHVLVEWIARLPIDLRLRGGWTKRILRDALVDLLPSKVHRRKSKLGFNTPDSLWMSGPLKQWLGDTLARPVHLPAVVDSAGVAQLMALHRQNRTSAGNDAMLLRLAMFEHWGGMFLRAGTTVPAALTSSV
jgi:asparagine synthase (glutamine-hydrolysing)